MSNFETGSLIAKNGFRNEDEIVYKFNNWKSDKEAQLWLQIMEYSLSEIESVKAVKVSGEKTDVQVQVTIILRTAIDVQNLQIKLVSNFKGFNQVDKRWVDRYKELWQITQDIVSIIKRYTGEEPPSITNPRNRRRMFADEFNGS